MRRFESCRGHQPVGNACLSLRSRPPSGPAFEDLPHLRHRETMDVTQLGRIDQFARGPLARLEGTRKTMDATHISPEDTLASLTPIK